jgi:lysozyme
LTSYKDVAGVWTIGYGSITNPRLGIKVYPKQTIDEATALKWMDVELDDNDPKISALVKVPLTQYQYDVLASFVYNVGLDAFKNSTLLRLLNRGDYTSVPAQLMRWTKARDSKTGIKRDVLGLKNRRKDEIRLWKDQSVSSVPPREKDLVPVVDITPTVNPAAASVVLKSDTTKAAGTILAGLLAISAENPKMLGLTGILALAVVYMLYRKYIDTRER